MEEREYLKRYAIELQARKEAGLYREITVFCSAQEKQVRIEDKKYHMFASNSYLDLCNDPKIKEYVSEILQVYGYGSGGSRLTTGTTKIHQELENIIAEWKGREAALVYNTGYMANVGILSALAKAGDVIYSDALNHASIIDGCRLSKAETVVYAHNDMKDLERKIKQHPKRSGIIVSDGVFSMDGDIVDLPGMLELSRKYQLLTILDEAHATGVIGETGKGTEEYYHREGEVDLIMGTLSKAVGSEGGYVCGSKLLIEYLKNTSRSFIFSTALSPITMAASIAGIRKIQKEPKRVRALQENIRYFRELLQSYGMDVHTETAIFPIMAYTEEKAVEWMKELKEAGYYVPAIRYPTVEKKKARLRIALMATHQKEELYGLAQQLATKCREKEGKV